MKNNFVSLSILLFVFAFILVPVQAAPVTRNLEFSGFTSVSAGHGMNVVINQGSSFRVTVTAEPETFERLKVAKRGTTLEFTMESSGWFRGRTGRIDVDITMPSLKRLDLSGGADGDLTMDVPSENVELEVSGGAEIHGQLRCSGIEIGASGGGEVTLTGGGENLRLDGSGGSELKLREFEVRDVAASLSGGTSATVNMNGTLDADLSGGSEIVYYGTANLGNTDFSGGSKVRKGR